MGFLDKLKGKAGEAREKAAEVAGEAREKVAEVTDQAKDFIEEKTGKGAKDEAAIEEPPAAAPEPAPPVIPEARDDIE